MKVKKIIFSIFVVIVCLFMNSCSKKESIEIDFSTTNISDFKFIKWYVNEYDIDLVLIKKFDRIFDKAENLIENISEDSIYKATMENPLIAEDYWKITSDILNFNCYYIGSLSNNKPNGFGILFDKDGTINYIGEFKKGRFSGLGVYYADDSQYMGEFKNGYYHGKGNFISYSYAEYGDLSNAHLNITTGEFKKNLSNGKYKIYTQGYLSTNANLNSSGTGTVTIYFPQSHQIKYKGSLKFFKYHGKGTLYKENGDIIYKGKWKNGDYK